MKRYADIFPLNHQRLEGIARQKYYKGEKFIDAAQYAIIKSDFVG